MVWTVEVVLHSWWSIQTQQERSMSLDKWSSMMRIDESCRRNIRGIGYLSRICFVHRTTSLLAPPIQVFMYLRWSVMVPGLSILSTFRKLHKFEPTYKDPKSFSTLTTTSNSNPLMIPWSTRIIRRHFKSSGSRPIHSLTTMTTPIPLFLIGAAQTHRQACKDIVQPEFESQWTS